MKKGKDVSSSRMGKLLAGRMLSGTLIDRAKLARQKTSSKKTSYIEAPEALAKFFRPVGQKEA